MEYVFGHDLEFETLQTKGDSHTDLKGFHRIEREYSDQLITDEFLVVEKVWSAKDDDGNCYDRYIIDKHFRVTDKSKSLLNSISESAESIENAMCEQDAEYSERIGAIEDAICELDEMINAKEV